MAGWGVSGPRTFSETGFFNKGLAMLKVFGGTLGLGKVTNTALFRKKEAVKEGIIWIGIGKTMLGKCKSFRSFIILPGSEKVL